MHNEYVLFENKKFLGEKFIRQGCNIIERVQYIAYCKLFTCCPISKISKNKEDGRFEVYKLIVGWYLKIDKFHLTSL